MIDIAILAELANVSTILSGVSKVARFAGRTIKYLNQDKSPKSPDGNHLEKFRAVESTLKEWEHIASLVEPRLKYDLKPQRHLDQRAEQLAFLATKYSRMPDRADAGSLDHMALVHTALALSQDGTLQILLGQSDQTRILRGNTLELKLDDQPFSRLEVMRTNKLRGEGMQLPTFKVTMLGGTGSGKTVFMSAMYTMLRDGNHGIAIRALNGDVDLELGDNIETLIRFNKWPLNTEKSQMRYDFELLLRNRPIARIDWVDYRGGDMRDPQIKEGAVALVERLRESHSIIWMVDLTKLNSGNLDSMRARIETSVGRMAALCRDALMNNDKPRAWVFVRTKADTVRGADGKPDWETACKELIQHLGPTIDIAYAGKYSRAAAIPVSSVGRLSNGTDGDLLGDDPTLVEWPLILSLAFLLDAEVSRLEQWKRETEEWRDAVRPGNIEALIRRFLARGLKEEELHAERNIMELTLQLYAMKYVIDELLKKCPSVVKLLHQPPKH
jgi:hypothetical protein